MANRGLLATVLMQALLCLPPGRAALAEDAARREDPLVARVNGQELRLSHVHASIESLSVGDQVDVRGQLGVYIEALINEEVLFQWALRSNFAGDAALRQEVKELVVRHLLETRVRSRVRVTEADARAYYEANPGIVRGEHVRIRRILLPERDQCEGLRAEIDSEEAFAEAARQHSQDAATAPSGGDLGLMSRGEQGAPSYAEQFFDMSVGEMRIFDVTQGCMLVRSVYHATPPLPPFAQVRDDLLRYLRMQQEAQFVERLFQQAGRHISVERFHREGQPVRGTRLALPGLAAPPTPAPAAAPSGTAAAPGR